MASTAVRRKWFRRVASVLALAMVAAACGGGGDDGGGGGGGDAAGEEGTPTPGGKVVYGLEAETTDGWCLPEAQLAIAGIMVADAIYDTLTRPNAEGTYEPWLAESVEPNDDYTEWTITLRDGVTFHDGTDLTAEVVKNNLDAYRGQYPTRNPLLFIFDFANIASVDVVDPLTVSVTMNEPWVAFDAYLYGSGRVGIMAQAQLDDTQSCDRNLIGTGPFMLTDWVPNQHFQAEKNPDYWATDADGNQLPYLDEIEFRPIVEVEQRENALHVRRDQRHAHQRPRDGLGPPRPHRVGRGQRLRVVRLRRGDLRDAQRVEAAVRQHQGPAGGGLRDTTSRITTPSSATASSPRPRGPSPRATSGTSTTAASRPTTPTRPSSSSQEYEEETGQPLSFTYTTTPGAGDDRAERSSSRSRPRPWA